MSLGTIRFKKGDTVRIFGEAQVFYLRKCKPEEDLESINNDGWQLVHEPDIGGSISHEAVKCLFVRKWAASQWGMVIGYTRKATGLFYPDRYHGPDIDPAYLAQDKRHLLVVVESYDLDDQRYRKPWFCLEDQLRLWERKE